ncbi:MAG: hypothetical protein RL722_125 [Pseudomonadota bacterium]
MAVAYSGGRDSTALLYATLQALGRLQATGWHPGHDRPQRHGWQVCALHVHHGLSPRADAWVEHGRACCERWAAAGWPVSFHVARVEVDTTSPCGVEAEARERRYEALAAMAQDLGCSLVLLGHHQDDQAETVLLQALRRSGMAGLAAMPRLAERRGLAWGRPWLQQRRSEIEAYVARHALAHIDDESNADPRWARNRLRLQVLPALEAGFANVVPALAQVARHADEARACLAELAALDLQVALRSSRDDPVGLGPGRTLDLHLLAGLGMVRASNALRHWLQAELAEPPTLALMDRLQTQALSPMRASGRWPVDGHRELRLHRGLLSLVRLSQSPSRPRLPEDVADEGHRGSAGSTLALDLSQPGVHPLPDWRGDFVVSQVPADAESGPVQVPFSCLCDLQLRARAGGEQWSMGPGRPARALKKQYQALGVPAWLREGPLLWRAGRLLYVPGLGLDAALAAELRQACAGAGGPGATLLWRPWQDPAAATVADTPHAAG